MVLSETKATIVGTDGMEKGILVTGAGGFIGSHLARKLHQEGHFVRAVDVKWDGYFEGAYCSERFTLDLRKYETCLQATRCADQVYHLAADMGGIDYITEVIADIMYNSGLMNMNMLQASVQNNVNRFFFSSSACVYREHKQLAPRRHSSKRSGCSSCSARHILRLGKAVHGRTMRSV